MIRARRFVIAAGATLAAGVISFVGFLLFGVLLPICAMIAIYGRGAVQDAPAHGGAVLLVTVPLAGIMSVLAFLILAIMLYRAMSKRFPA